MPDRASTTAVRYDISLLTDYDLHLCQQGSHYRLYEKLGSHLLTIDGVAGTYFAVWAPNAEQVFVMGDFNGWDKGTHPLQSRGSSGIWEGFIPCPGQWTNYKYHLVSRYNGYRVDKADPFGCHHETPPKTGSIVTTLDYDWGDQEWMSDQAQHNSISSPVSVYEVHLGSWMRVAEEGNRFLSYRELAPKIAEYVQKMGFTHVELLPVMEHPFYGSWGYQTTGYFAPTSRYGTPQDFMYLVDHLHQHQIGVILDWVPAHFPGDEHGLAYFDGSHLYEHADPRKGLHPEWDTLIFNYASVGVQNFLASSALFWLDKYHADGLRLDAVTSMLYLDYHRQEGEWIPNELGGRENLEAIDFLRSLNESIHREFPATLTIAEETTGYPTVSRPTSEGGLGFDLTWDLGWTHDTLEYLSIVPELRKSCHDKLTFRQVYAFTQSFLLPLGHDEVKRGMGSLLVKMPGDDRQKFANLRLLLGWMYAQPGKKLLFMGEELGPWREWDHDTSLDWHLSDSPSHAGIQSWVAALNQLYRTEPALYELELDQAGFKWIDGDDADNSVVSFIRQGRSTDDLFLAISNFSSVTQYDYWVGVPRDGFWQEVLNSDAVEHGGSEQGGLGGAASVPVPFDGQPHSLSLTLPALTILWFKHEVDRP